MISLLQEARIFKDCTSRELADVAAICEQVAFGRGEHICEADSPAEYLYVVNDGIVELRFSVTHYLAAKEIALEHKHRGESFGWSALTKPHTYTLSAVAAEDCELLKIGAKDIQKVCAENHHLGYVLMRNLAEVIGERFDLVRRMLIKEIQHELQEKDLLSNP